MFLCLAPMDWVTDLPCRVITKKIFERYNQNKNYELLLWTEFMTSDWFLACPENVIKSIIHTPYENPLIIQIFWWNKEKLIDTATKIQDLYWTKIAWIELNTGCPANNIIKSWWWSALMKDKELTLNIIKDLSSKLNIPFSIKSRTGLDNIDKSRHLDFLVQASHYCDKISIHSRTLKELYHGEGDRNFIYELKSKANKECKIIWNWAITTYNDIMLKSKKNEIILDWIMIWQAAIWNPRIFTNHNPNTREKIETAIEHLVLQAKYEIYLSDIKQNRKQKIYPSLQEIELIKIEENLEKIHYTPLFFRKYFHQYVKWIPWWKEAKQECNKTTKLNDLIEILKKLNSNN